MKRTDLLRDQWASLGVAFAAGKSVECDPESALINLVSSREFPEDKKMISIALAWLKEYSTLVHIEKLKQPAAGLDKDAAAILGALALKCIKFGDHRWKTIERISIEILRGQKSVIRDPDAFLKRHGLDEDFLKFGISVTPILAENSKKLLARAKVFKMNSWLRHRLLFGTNLRADIATAKYLKITDTAYGAAKILGCSMNAAYRNWKALEEAGWAGPV